MLTSGSGCASKTPHHPWRQPLFVESLETRRVLSGVGTLLSQLSLPAPPVGSSSASAVIGQTNTSGAQAGILQLTANSTGTTTTCDPNTLRCKLLPDLGVDPIAKCPELDNRFCFPRPSPYTQDGKISSSPLRSASHLSVNGNTLSAPRADKSTPGMFSAPPAGYDLTSTRRMIKQAEMAADVDSQWRLRR
jgi:hypothetical protein